MSTTSHQRAAVAPDERHLLDHMTRDVWASLAITAMWIAVCISAVWGPDFVSSDGAGTNTTTIPLGIFVAFFATLGTWAVARYGFAGQRDDK